jgi:hypothetical protein
VRDGDLGRGAGEALRRNRGQHFHQPRAFIMERRHPFIQLGENARARLFTMPFGPESIVRIR